MLQFAAIDASALSIHDSFIMHHGYVSELEENMRRGFYERFGRGINVKHEMVEEIVHNEDDDIEPKSLTFYKIIEIKNIHSGQKEAIFGLKLLTLKDTGFFN